LQLIILLKDEDDSVCEGAIRALGLIGDSRAVDPIIDTLDKDNTHIQSAAGTALSNIGEPAVEPLINVLKSRWLITNKVLTAASALGNIGDERAVDPLLDLVKSIYFLPGEFDYSRWEDYIFASNCFSKNLSKIDGYEPRSLLPYLEEKSTLGVYSFLITEYKNNSNNQIVKE